MTPEKLKRAQYLHRANVRCSFDFPIDMLRHDRCWPSTSEDAMRIDRLNDRQMRRSLEEHERNVRVTCLSHHKRFEDAFTIGRWQSFSCQIEEGL